MTTPVNHTTSALQAHGVLTSCQSSLLYMGTKPVLCSCSSTVSFRTVHCVLCFSTAVLSTSSRICHSFPRCQNVCDPVLASVVSCRRGSLYVAPAPRFGHCLSFEPTLWCGLACMAFYMPLSHLLSSEMMAPVTKFHCNACQLRPGVESSSSIFINQVHFPTLCPCSFVQPWIVADLSVLKVFLAPQDCLI